MMRMCRRLALLTLLLIIAGRGARSQEEVPAVQTEVVQVGVVVTDKDGRVVRDLAREEFVVLEDGKRQRITHFVVAGKQYAAVPEGASAPNVPAPQGAGPAVAAEPGRDIVVVLDDLHIGRANLDTAKEALRLFVDELMGAADSVAIITTAAPGGIRQLTQDRAVLRQAIDRLGARETAAASARGMQMTTAQAELVLRGDHSALQLATRMLMDEPGSVVDSTGPRATVEASSGGFTPAGVEPGEKAAVREVQRQALVVLGSALGPSETTLRVVTDVLHSLSSRSGRKVCVLVTDGFLVGTGTSAELTRQMRQVVDAATRSGTAVHVLDVRGPASAGADAGVEGPAAPPGLRERVARLAEQEAGETLVRLATDTGGLLVRGGSEVAPGLRRVLEDDEASHLIAYEPSNTKRDGKFRTIEVRLPRHAEFTVRARRGYFAPDDRKQTARSDTPTRPLAGAAAPAAFDEAEARAALEAPLPPSGAPVQMSADYLELPPAGPQVVVRAHVDLSGIRWREAGERRQATLDLVCGVYDAGGKAVGAAFGKQTELDLGPEEWKRAVEAGVQYRQQVSLRPGRYQVRLVAREPKLAPFGGAVQWVEIPELGDKKLAMSGVFLSSSPAPTGASSGAEESPTLRESDTRRFRSTDSLYFQFYVYNPRIDDKGKSDVVVQAQIWSEGKVVAASKPKAAALEKKDGMPVPETNGMPLESLAPGSYELRVVVVDRKVNVTAFRNVDFTVGRAND
jgi:VWFA-related protein